MYNNCDTDAENTNLACCLIEQAVKQPILNDVVLRKEELKRQLNALSTFMEDMIKRHITVVSQLYENFNDLWNKYQITMDDLDRSKGHKDKYLNIIVDDLYKKYETFKYHLEEHYEENIYLESKYIELKKCLNEEKKNTICLKDENQYYIKCLEQKSEELNQITKKLIKKTDELNKEKEETLNVKSKLDDVIRKVEKFKLEELKQIKNIDILKTKIEIEKNCNKELTQTICEQKNQIQELTDVLEKCNKKIEGLKQTIEEENVQANNSINKLQKEKLNVEKEKAYLDKDVKETKEKIEKLMQQNQYQKTHINELQCELDTAIKNSTEKETLSLEKIEKINKDTNKLMTDIESKNQFIIELEEQLLKTKKRYKTQAENSHNLKLQLENVVHKQNLMPMKCEENLIADHNNYSLTNCMNEIQDNAKLDGATLTSSVEYTDSTTDHFGENN